MAIEYRHNPSDDLSAAEHQERCCDESKQGIPCGKSGKVEVWNGPELQDHWPESTKRLIERAKTDPTITIKFAPRTKPCGTKTTKWVGSKDCCDQPAPDFVFTESVLSVRWNTSYRFCVAGGTPPYSWGTSGSGLSISGQGECAILSVDDCFCEPGEVICQDSCNRQVVAYVESFFGHWETVGDNSVWVCDPYWDELLWSEDNPELVTTGALVQWEGGKSPYTVTVSGNGVYLDSDFSLDVIEVMSPVCTLYAEEDACGMITVSVTDQCGNSCQGKLRAMNGVWELKDSGGQCFISATMDEWREYDGVSYTIIDEDKKYITNTTAVSYGAYCGCTSLHHGCDDMPSVEPNTQDDHCCITDYCYQVAIGSWPNLSVAQNSGACGYKSQPSGCRDDCESSGSGVSVMCWSSYLTSWSSHYKFTCPEGL